MHLGLLPLRHDPSAGSTRTGQTSLRLAVYSVLNTDGVAVADEVPSLLVASPRRFSYEGCVLVATQAATRSSAMRSSTPPW